MIKSYELALADAAVYHYPLKNRYFRDAAPRGGAFDGNLQMHARVRSGDYFATIATEIERVIETLAQKPKADRRHGLETADTASSAITELERLAAEFIEIGKAYELTPKE